MWSKIRGCLRFVVLLIAVAISCTSRGPRLLAQGSAAGGDSPKPVHWTAEWDHQRSMELLHITELRKGPSGDLKAPDGANVDESKVPLYALPDPLILKTGKKVT